MIKLKSNIVIGITGRHGSGKDTVISYMSDILYPIYGQVTILSLNISALETVAEVFETDPSFIEKNKHHPIVRNALEFTGSQYIPQYVGAHQTTVRLREDIEKYTTEGEGKIFLISSVYRIFEAELIQNTFGGMMIHLERKFYTDIRRDSYAEDTALLPIETEITKIVPDFYLRNDNTIDRLYFSTKDMLTQLMNMNKWKEKLA